MVGIKNLRRELEHINATLEFQKKVNLFVRSVHYMLGIIFVISMIVCLLADQLYFGMSLALGIFCLAVIVAEVAKILIKRKLKTILDFYQNTTKRQYALLVLERWYRFQRHRLSRMPTYKARQFLSAYMQYKNLILR